jgi:hypothetical protein
MQHRAIIKPSLQRASAMPTASLRRASAMPTAMQTAMPTALLRRRASAMPTAVQTAKKRSNYRSTCPTKKQTYQLVSAMPTTIVCLAPISRNVLMSLPSAMPTGLDCVARMPTQKRNAWMPLPSAMPTGLVDKCAAMCFLVEFFV